MVSPEKAWMADSGAVELESLVKGGVNHARI